MSGSIGNIYFGDWDDRGFLQNARDDSRRKTLVCFTLLKFVFSIDKLQKM